MNTTRIEFAPGHEDETLTEQDVVAKLRLMNAAPKLLEVVRISIGNVRSLGPAGALDALPHAPYREWLAQLEAAYAAAEGRSLQEQPQ